MKAEKGKPKKAEAEEAKIKTEKRKG
jgi:hypothetical protein